VVIDYVHTGGTSMGSLEDAFSASRGGAPIRGGGGGMPPLQRDVNLWNAVTARTLADLTGGRYFWNQYRNVATDMDYLDAATRFEYVLGYYPSNTRYDGRFRRIVVRVNRPGLTVLYRHGYYANEELAPFDRERMITESRISAAAAFVKPVPDVPLKVLASQSVRPGTPSEVRLVITVDPSPIDFTKTAGRNAASIELVAACLNDRDALVGDAWKTVKLSYTDERLAAVKRDGISIELTVPARAPAKTVKVIVYDYGADRVGSMIAKVSAAK